MSLLNIILDEIKDVPADRLEELYQYVHSLTPKTKQSVATRNKILSFGGSFSELNDMDYTDFLEQTKKSRSNLFDRKIEL